jgi:ABC-type sugar transport system ATPase subunit/ribose/xylose/arabinose/galactoside ABC-type transport system permease subunit
MSVLVELEKVDKAFAGAHALREVDLSLQSGRVHALVGENGAGKSTLINILSGVLTPDRGLIRFGGQPMQFTDARSARKQGIVTVHQEADLFADLSIAENIGLEWGLPTGRLGWIDWRRQRRQTVAALSAIGEALDPSALARTLTAAQRQMVEIAAAVARQARVLILDEPTSSLSAAETKVLFRHLRGFRDQGTAILYVSHRLEEIFELADEVTVLRDGCRVWTGPLADSSPSHLIGLMVGREVTASAPRSDKEPGPVRLRCQGLTAKDGAFHDITLEVRGGEILGLYGLIGAGRSEWAQAIFGLRGLASGTVWLDGQSVALAGPGAMIQRGVAYVPEDRLRQGLCRGLSVRANLVLASLRRLAFGPWISGTREVRQASAAADRLRIRLRSVEQPAGTLSGGNQQKVVLGRWLDCDPRVLILDEPTRGVDVGAKAEIHTLIHRLAEEGRAVVLISSDLPEVLAQSDRLAVFREGRLTATFDPRATSAETIAAAAIPSGEAERQGDGETRRQGEDATLGHGLRTVPSSSGDLRSGGGAWSGDHAPTRSSPRLLVSLSPRLLVSLSPRLLVSRFFRETALVLIVLMLFGVVEWRSGGFLEARLMRELATNTALLSYCAIGAALVILAGGLDISLGALMALSAGVAGRLWEQGYSLPIVAGVTLLIGGAGGMLNALLSLLGRVHPIVITLGTMSLYRGLTLWWLRQDVQISGAARNWIFAEALGLPLIAWSGLVLAVLTGLFLYGTVAGRELYAFGSNPSAARRVGIRGGRVWLRAFTLQGMLAGLAGLLLLARSGNLQPTSYEDKTLEAIAAVVVGGVAITGGRGSVLGVVIGCLFLVSLRPVCVLLHVAPDWQRTLVGVVMAVAVVLDTLWRRQRT